MAGLMEMLGDFSTLVSVGQDVEGIFSGPTPTLQDVEAAFTADVAAIFLNAQVQQEVITATSSLQSARDFFAINYRNDVKDGVDAGDLWAALSSDAPKLTELDATAVTVDGWLQVTDDQPVPKDMISTATSVCLGIYLHMCLLHRERASVAPTPQLQKAETDDLRDYAQKALANMQMRVMNRIANRLTCLSIDSQSIVHSGRTLDHAALTDSWFDGSNSLVSNNIEGDPRWTPSVAIQHLVGAYRRLLWSGSDADYNQLLALLRDPSLGGAGGNDFHYSDLFIASSLPGVRAFGQWSASTRQVLCSLGAMATGFPGQLQDDWHSCSRCGALFYGTGVFPDDGIQRCPAGGQHAIVNSGDYAINSLPPANTAPASTQDGWRWCSRCDVLFYSPDPSVCPAGGAHTATGSGNYFLVAGDSSLSAWVGLTVAAQPFLWCPRCGALHESGAASVCPAGGAHQASGSADYWLSNLGTWPGP